MMANKHGIMQIVCNIKIAKDVYKMIVKGDGVKYIQRPGQFVNLKIDNIETYLRRPMSICDYDYATNSLTIIYKVVGIGTRLMQKMQPNEYVDMLIGLGNGFMIPNSIKTALLVGGGVGVPPLYKLAKDLHQKDINVVSVFGFRNKEDIFYEEEFKQFGQVYIATDDGSYGFKGNVIELIKEKKIRYDKYFACGPERMLDGLVLFDHHNGYLSFEERMGCGFGACMGCSCKVKTAPYKRICVEGPVLEASEVIVSG